eukprot:363694-Chlamydomonas_euryale.AAC.3
MDRRACCPLRALALAARDTLAQVATSVAIAAFAALSFTVKSGLPEADPRKGLLPNGASLPPTFGTALTEWSSCRRP